MTSPRPDGAPYPEGAPRPDGGTDALDSLVTLGFVVTATMTRIGAAHDLSFTLVRVLGLLEDAPRRVSDLAAHLGLEKQTRSGLVARAERRGLLERVPGEEDRRSVLVRLTAAGRTTLESVKREGRAELSPALEVLGATGRRQLGTLLDRVLRHGPAPHRGEPAPSPSPRGDRRRFTAQGPACPEMRGM